MSESPAAPAKLAALHHPDYRRYISFTLLSAMADNIEHVISYWVIFQAFHSPMLAGFAVISHWVPFLLSHISTVVHGGDITLLFRPSRGTLTNIRRCHQARRRERMRSPGFRARA